MANKTKLKDFQNSIKAEPWKVYEQERKEDTILALRDDRPGGIVPGAGVVAGLTAAVDTQKYGFWYEIRAWGYGITKESWQIRAGYVTTFDDLVQVLWEDQYVDADGKRYIVHLTVQDAMGGAKKDPVNTSAVYDFCRMHRGRILPFKGEQRMNQPFAYTNIEYYPGTKKPIPGGIKLLRGNTNYYKNDLSDRLEITPADPGAWHYHSETTPDWAIQMTVEYIDEKTGFWECPPGRDNHAWDCSVYNLIAADVIGIKYWKKGKEKTAPAKTRRVISKGVSNG